MLLGPFSEGEALVKKLGGELRDLARLVALETNRLPPTPDKQLALTKLGSVLHT